MDDNIGVIVVLDIVRKMLRGVDVATYDRLELFPVQAMLSALYLVRYRASLRHDWILRSYVLGSRCV